MINIRTYAALPFNEEEILRYAGVRDKSEDMIALMRDAIEEAKSVLTYRVCSREFDITQEGCTIDFGFAKIQSEALAKRLSGSFGAVIFAATVGIGLDRLIARYGAVSPSKALMLQAIGAERIESLCDRFCSDMQDEYRNSGKSITQRFSPGYGDLNIEAQKEIFRVLDCSRQIGLTLNESMLMSPSKSVTAIVGIRNG